MSCPSHDFAAFVLPCGKFGASHHGCVEPGRRNSSSGSGLGWWQRHWECPGHRSGGGFSWLISSQTLESIGDPSAVLNWMSGIHFQPQIKPMEFHEADWQAGSHCRSFPASISWTHRWLFLNWWLEAFLFSSCLKGSECRVARKKTQTTHTHNPRPKIKTQNKSWKEKNAAQFALCYTSLRMKLLGMES